MAGKIKNLDSLTKIVNKLKQKKKKIVFTNGCFDLLHPGHIKLFREAKKRGDVLIVGVNSDASIKKIKGRERPILSQKARLTLLQALEMVDYITIFDAKTPYSLIKKIKPDYLVKGSDWRRNDIVGKDLVKKVVRVKLAKGYSTSKIIERIRKINL